MKGLDFSRFHRFWAQERNLSVFLFLLLAAIVLLPVFNDLQSPNRLLVDSFFALLLLSGILSISSNRFLIYFTTVLVVISPLCRELTSTMPRDVWTSVHGAISIMLTALFLLVILAQVLSQGVVTIHRIQGAIAAYILIALIWALLYSLLEQLSPGAFQLPPSGKTGEIGVEDFVYFSVVTLTTTGFGDIIAVQSVARSFVMLESLIGQLFPAILIARLVTLHTQNGVGLPRDEDPSSG